MMYVSEITKSNFEYFPHPASSSADMTTAIDHVSMIKSSSISGSSKEQTMNKSETPSRSSKLKSSELDNLNDSNDVFDSSSCEIMTNKFQQTTITTNKSTNHETYADDRHPSWQSTEYNLGALLSTLFPTNMTDIDPEEDFKKYVKCSSSNDQFQFMNELTIHLKNVENAKALKHQWAKSAAKSFLVKSLGIDSRNIVRKFIIKQ